MSFDSFQRHSLKTRVTLFTLVIFFISIWSLAFYTSRLLRVDMQRLLSEQQLSTSAMAAKAIDEELSDRLQALETVARELSPVMQGAPGKLQTRLEDLPVFQALFNGGTYVTGLDGIAMAAVPSSLERLGVNYRDRDYIASALMQGQTTIGRPIVGKKLKAPMFAAAVPIRDAQGQVIGALAGNVNLGMVNFLDKITETHYGAGGSFLLVAPQHRLIVTASDKSRNMETLPPPNASPTLDRFIGGFEGSQILVNPLGVEVLASVKRVPTAGWYVAVTLPTQEVFAPVHTIQLRMLQATFLLTLLAAGLIWWMLKRQLAPLQSTARTLATLSDRHQPLHPLPVIRQDEIGQLISGFNRLLADLAQRQEGLQESEERYRTAFQTSPDAVNITCLADGRYLEVNEGFSHLFGWSREDVIGKTSRDIGIWCNWDDRYPLIHKMQQEGHCENFEATLATKAGKALTVLVSANRITLRGEPCMLSVTRDISERKAAEAQIEQLAFSDPLTGLPNRRLLIDRLQQAQAARAHYRNQGALLLVDLDHFKTLNDTHGHDTGDLLLQQAAQRLQACVREGDTVARSGGDEFVVLLKHLSQNPQEAATQAETVGEKILAALSQPYPFDSGPYHGTSSIGIALLGIEQENTIEPLKRAELAMYQGKAAGRNTLRFFDPQMQAVVSARSALEAGLREGILKNQFLLHYQAQVTDERQLIGVEALLRWQDPRRGMVSPAEFIPLAEETGLILPLGSWVLETACTQLARWASNARMAHLTVAVNVSARQLHQSDFVDQVLSIIERTGANPNRLKLELTESLLVTNIEEVITKMNALKAKGVGFSLDDFGTGYSSLSYLKRLPLGQLKIDQGFVRDILINPNDAAIAKMVIALANSLGLAVIAEGVETDAQRAALAALGCHCYQGYLFSRPLPLQEFETFALGVTAGSMTD